MVIEDLLAKRGMTKYKTCCASGNSAPDAQ